MNFLKHNSFLIALLLIPFVLSVTAQDDDVILPAVGDVPLAGKIQVTADETDETQALIAGEAGAVFPNAFVAVQNLYTGDREIVSSTSNGEFTANLYGRNQTPYWIAAFQRFPSDEAIENAIGTTVYGEGEDNTFYVESDLGGNVPRYRIWGEVNTTQLIDDEPLTLLLNVELDITDNFPEVDDLELKLELELRESTLIPADLTTVTIHANDIVRTEDQLLFSAEVEWEGITDKRVMPYLTAYIRIGDGEWERWGRSGLFGLLDNTLVKDYTIVLPIDIDGVNQADFGLDLVLNIGDITIDFSSFPTFQILQPGMYSIVPTIYLKHDELYAIGGVSGTLEIEVSTYSQVLDTFKLDVIQANRRLHDKAIQLVVSSDVLDNYSFEEYGSYAVLGSVNLVIGDKAYNISKGGNGNIQVAETFYVNPSMLEGTPLQVGDSIVRSGHLSPQLPAQVHSYIFAYTASGHETYEIDMQANRDGYFSASPFLIEEPGIYAVKYEVSYTDADGRLWMADDNLSSSTAALATNHLAHGQRGLVGYGGMQQAWFDTTIYPDDDRNAAQQPYFPYYSGDVVYIPDMVDAGILPIIKSEIDSNRYTLSVASPNGQMRKNFEYYMNEIVPLNTDDTFKQQIGMGINGIRAGDYAFLFGGVSVDDESAIYGALMIVEDEDAPARVLSPFMDKLNVFGQEVDMFFVPTGVRPAQVLTQGEALSIVGQVAPTLPAEVEVTVTSPSGQKTHFEDVANAVGYFYSAENDFPLGEIGIWHVDIAMTYHGETSAGHLEKPYPEGHLAYDVYVVPPDNPPLGDSEFMTETSNVTKTYALSIPDGWTNVRAFATVTTPSWILSQEELTVFPAGTSYIYNPTQLAREYPNVELLETAEGNHVADVLTLTLAMTGTDADGNPAIRTRTYTILHDETYTYDEAVIR